MFTAGLTVIFRLLILTVALAIPVWVVGYSIYLILR